MTSLVGPPDQFIHFVRESEAGLLYYQTHVGRCERVFQGGFPWRVWAVANLQAPDASGQPLAEERNMIETATEELLGQVAHPDDVLFLGTVIHQGQYVLVLHSRLANALAAPPASRLYGSHYQWDVYTEEDADAEFLQLRFFPSVDELRQIKDQEVLEALAGANDNPIAPRPITFFGLFPKQDLAQNAARELDQQGFRTSPPSEMPGKNKFSWSLMFSRTASTEPDVIEHLSGTAARIVRREGGHYDGWECAPMG